MTGTEQLTTPYRAGGLPSRLVLLPAGSGPHRLDGTWRPRTLDLGAELPALIAGLDERWPGITRVTVSRSLWRTVPDALLLGERAVRISRSEASHRPHRICLLSYGVGRCDLLVVPPGAAVTDPAA